MERKHRILFLSNNILPYRGGIARVTNLISHELEKRGHEIYYVCYVPFEKGAAPKNAFQISEQDNYKELISKIEPIIKDNKVDVIINQDQSSDSILEFLQYVRLKYATKILYFLHNSPDFTKYWYFGWKHSVKEKLHKLRYGYYTPAIPFRKAYEVCDRYVLLSELYKPVARAYYHLERKNRLAAIPNPVGEITSKQINFEEKKKQFLIVTRLVEFQKNLKSALRIWQKFEDKDSEYTLKIAGYGDDEKELMAYARELGIKRMEFVGKIPDPSTLYEESRYFIMTSRYEGFPMALVEAQQHGCLPIVFDSFKAVHDVITEGKNGWIVKAGNEGKFVGRMAKAVAAEDKSRQMSKQARSSVSRFGVEKIATEWEKLIDSII